MIKLNKQKIVVILMFLILVLTSINSWCLSNKEEDLLLDKISLGLDQRGDISLSKGLNSRIARMREERDIYNEVMHANPKAINIYIANALIKKMPYHIAKEIFGKAIRRGIADRVTYTSFITAAGNAGHFREAEDTYNEARGRYLADIVTYNSFITAAGNAGHFREAEDAYNEARGRGLADIFTYNSFITAAGNAGRFEEAQKAFEEAKKRQLANIVTYTGFITAAGNAGHFREAEDAYNEARGRRLADIVTYNSFITAAGNAGRFEEAQKAFEEAKNRQLANIVTYNSFITAAGNAGRFEEAQKAFEEAKGRQLANIVTYTSFITAAGNAGRFEEAQKAFEEAKDRQLANIVTYTSFITAAGNAGRFEEAQKAFEEAKHRELADEVTYNNYINCLFIKGDIAGAIKVFLNYYPKYRKRIDIESPVNLHGFGHGAAYIACHILMQEMREGEEVVLIIGRGTHSEDEHIIRRTVGLFAGLHRESVVIKDVPGHGGRVLFRRVGLYNENNSFNVRFTYDPNFRAKEAHWNMIFNGNVIEPAIAFGPTTITAEAATTTTNRGSTVLVNSESGAPGSQEVVVNFQELPKAIPVNKLNLKSVIGTKRSVVSHEEAKKPRIEQGVLIKEQLEQLEKHNRASSGAILGLSGKKVDTIMPDVDSLREFLTQRLSKYGLHFGNGSGSGTQIPQSLNDYKNIIYDSLGRKDTSSARETFYETIEQYCNKEEFSEFYNDVMKMATELGAADFLREFKFE